MQMKSEVLFYRDVAYLLDCSPDEVLNLARTGRLPGVKQGKFWRFNRADVMVYMRLQKKAKERLARIA
jgi:excisionase family DNA binding protein